MEFAKKRKFDTTENLIPYEAPPPPLDNAVLEAPSPCYNVVLTKEDARNLLRPLTPEQLIGILQFAVICHPDILESFRLHTDKDIAFRKLFVRGLAGKTNSDSHRRLFSAFSDLDKAIDIHDKSTRKSKGFGFVMFKHADSTVLATFRSSGPSNIAAADVSARKIYLSCRDSCMSL